MGSVIIWILIILQMRMHDTGSMLRFKVLVTGRSETINGTCSNQIYKKILHAAAKMVSGVTTTTIVCMEAFWEVPTVLYQEFMYYGLLLLLPGTYSVTYYT